MRKFRIRYVKNAHQAEFAADRTHKILHMSSGFGGGKSYGLVMKAFDLSNINRNFPGGLVNPSLADYKKDVLPIIEDVLERHKIPYKHHKSENWFKFPWSRSKLHIASAEKKLRGPNWGWACINEVTLISHQRFKEVLGRVRIKGCPHPQIAMSGTPEGTAHWLYEVLIDKPAPNSRIIYGDTRANQDNLADDYIQTLEANYDQVMLDAYLRGLFVNMNSNRFYYGYDPIRNDDRTIKQIEGATVYISLDYNVAPMCATLWNVVTLRNARTGAILVDAMGQPMRKMRGFGQIEIKNDATTEKFCHAMRERGLDPDNTYIYPDPAGRARSTQGPPDNDILRQNGWHNIKVKLVAPQFRKRQLAMNAMLAKGMIVINPDECPGIKRDFEAVEQDQATYEKLKDNPKLTHYSDGADYMVDIEFPLMGSKPSSGSIKVR